jgi:hypothetical protein
VWAAVVLINVEQQQKEKSFFHGKYDGEFFSSVCG